MIGIYCFENKVNNKKYIGQSVKVNTRIKQHIDCSKNKKYVGYDTKFYRALRKYGVDNFNAIMLEECDECELDDREIYWISFYDTYKNGYNSNRGGFNVTERNEEHPMAKLTNVDVLKIKDELLNNTRKSFRKIAQEFGISQSEISGINDGSKWKEIGDCQYPIRIDKNNVRHGENNATSILSDNQVLEIRNRYMNESCTNVYKDYKDILSYVSFERACMGRTYSYLPIYKKKEKIWINK